MSSVNKYLKKILRISVIIAFFVFAFLAVSLMGNVSFVKNGNTESEAAFLNVSDENVAEEEKTVETTAAWNDGMAVDENEEMDLDEELHFDKSDWKLILVNKEHPIPDDYSFELATISGSMECDARILEPLNEMFAAAKEEGINLVVCSPYRELSRQEYLFDKKMKGYLNSGYSYVDAYKESSAVVTVPGSSEHQMGLALDLISDNYYRLDEAFANTDAGKWLKKNAHLYGFILRYPKGKEEITGIIYEPWHFRYVGREAAEIIYKNNLTLEEFVEGL